MRRSMRASGSFGTAQRDSRGHVVCVDARLRAAADARQVTAQDLRDGLKNPTRWLTYGGDYGNHRHSPLTQITPANVNRLAPQWQFQTDTLGKFEAAPLVFDGVIYVTGPLDTGWALDARTGRQIWRYRRDLPERPHRLLRPRQPRLRRPGRPPLQDDARRARRGDQPQDRRDRVGYGDGEFPPRLQRDDRAARGERQSDRRHRRRRVRRSRFHRCLRCADGQAGLAVLHDRGPRGSRPRHVARHRCEGVGARRRIDLGARRLRSGAQSHVLGHRQRGTRLQRRSSAKATTCTPRRSSRSTPTRASCAGTINSRRTTSGTTTRRRCRCWPTSRSAASRERSCCSRIATASSTCSIARPAS